MAKKIAIFLLYYIWASLSWGIPDRIYVTILHSNDYHGHLLPYDLPGQKGVGGMAARMSFIREVRREVAEKGGYLIVLDAGDVNTGDPLSDMFRAEPDIYLMNLMGYCAMAMGNHEFDLRLGEIRKMEERADFPLLSANVFSRTTQDLLFSPVVIWQIKDIKIAVFGITPPDTPEISTFGNDPEFLFEEPGEVIAEILSTLDGKVDFTIGILHLKHREVIELAEEFPEIDLIIGGHTHLPIAQPVKVGETLIAEAGHGGMMMGRWDLCFEGRKLIEWNYRLVGINLSQPIVDENGKILCEPFSETFPPDREVMEFLTPYIAKSEEFLNAEIGVAEEDLPMGIPRAAYPVSSPLGNLVADAMRERVEADIALQNIGGIRADLLKGSVTYRDVKKILPFANTIVTYQVSGENVMAILSLIATRDTTQGGYFEVSGITFTVKDQTPYDVKVGGETIIPWRIYKLATNSFIARGGDNYGVFMELPGKADTGIFLSDVLAEYIRQNSPIHSNTEVRMIWLR